MRIADWFPTSRQKSGQEQHTSSEAQKPPDFCASKFPEVSAVIYVSVSCLSASAFRGSMQQLLASACMVYDVQCMNLCLPAAQVWSSFVNSLADFGFAGQPCGTPEQVCRWEPLSSIKEGRSSHVNKWTDKLLLQKFLGGVLMGDATLNACIVSA
eukprot:scaffold39820_cov19-Tisochrysis_lutea.AAC.1